MSDKGERGLEKSPKLRNPKFQIVRVGQPFLGQICVDKGERGLGKSPKLRNLKFQIVVASEKPSLLNKVGNILWFLRNFTLMQQKAGAF